MFWTAYYVFYLIVYIFFFYDHLMVAVSGMSYLLAKCLYESKTRIPQDTFLFPEAALRPGRGACLLPCLLLLTFTLSVSETLNVTVMGSCEQLSFTPEVLLNSSVTPETHLIISLGV